MFINTINRPFQTLYQFYWWKKKQYTEKIKDRPNTSW